MSLWIAIYYVLYLSSLHANAHIVFEILCMKLCFSNFILILYMCFILYILLSEPMP